MGVFYEPAIVPQPVAIVMQAAMAGSSFSLTERHYRLLKRAPSAESKGSHFFMDLKVLFLKPW